MRLCTRRRVRRALHPAHSRPEVPVGLQQPLSLREPPSLLRPLHKAAWNVTSCPPLLALGLAVTALTLVRLSPPAAFVNPGLLLHLRRVPGATLRRCDGSEFSEYQGVRWVKKRWQWAAEVPDIRGGVDLDCGFYDTELEAAKAFDCAQLAQDQQFPGLRTETWRRNLPKDTIYQDEVDDLIKKLQLDSADASGAAGGVSAAPEPAETSAAQTVDGQRLPGDDTVGAVGDGTASSPQIVVAKFGCTAEAEDELTFRRGDRLEVLDDSDADWWRCRLLPDGMEGFVPSNYVVPAEPESCADGVQTVNGVGRAAKAD